MGFSKKYILILLSSMYLLTNVPLFHVFHSQNFDLKIIAKLILHNPNQYLFYFVFFLFATVALIYSGFRLINYIRDKYDKDEINRIRRIFLR